MGAQLKLDSEDVIVSLAIKADLDSTTAHCFNFEASPSHLESVLL